MMSREGIIGNLLVEGFKYLNENNMEKAKDSEKVLKPLIDYINNIPSYSIKYAFCESITYLMEKAQNKCISQIIEEMREVDNINKE